MPIDPASPCLSVPSLADFLPSNTEQLQIRIDAADPIRLVHLSDIGSSIVTED